MLGFSWFIIIILQGCLALLLTRKLGISLGLTLHVLLMLAFSGLGWLMLSQLSTDSITWRNRLISILMPWPAIVGGGSMFAFVLKNAIASIVFAGIVVTADRSGILNIHRTGSDPSSISIGSPWMTWATVLCWMVLTVAWLWLIKSTLSNRPDSFSVLLSSRNTAIPFIFPPIVVIASLFLRYQGYVIAALLTVAIPLVIVLLPVLMMLAVVFYHYATGKPMRWN